MKQEANKSIRGFSKLGKQDKINWVTQQFFHDSSQAADELQSFWHGNAGLQSTLDGFSENTLSNFHLPYSVAPNFLINGQEYCVPMVIEESSVVAAASSAAKFWQTRGGFRAEILGTAKVGQVHFSWKGDHHKIPEALPSLKKHLLAGSQSITANMDKRGGGVLDIEWLDMGHLEPDYHQLRVTFETCDSMGANFINSVLESFAMDMESFFAQYEKFVGTEKEVQVIMAILSNHTPDCLVRAEVSCLIPELGHFPNGMDAERFAEKFQKAVRIAYIDPYRATTHNKGIFNGVDAVVLATANDFRAIEANGHAYACRDGQYRSLSQCSLENGIFRFWLDIPLTLGTVGGLTQLHPLAKRSLEMLGKPSAKELMGIIAAVGLAQNFAAVRSLVTTGIQKGHMKMHLMNILQHLGAQPEELGEAQRHFASHPVSYSAVREFLLEMRVVKAGD